MVSSESGILNDASTADPLAGLARPTEKLSAWGSPALWSGRFRLHPRLVRDYLNQLARPCGSAIVSGPQPQRPGFANFRNLGLVFQRDYPRRQRRVI